MTRATVICVALLLAAGFAQAASVSPFNDRPATITTYDSPTLQDMLDTYFYGLDAYADQSSAGYFMLAVPGSTVTSPQLKVKSAGGGVVVNLFSLPGLDDSNPISSLSLFPGLAAEGDTATVTWLTADSGLVTFIDVSAATATISSFSGVSRNGFGFSFEVASYGKTFYTLDDLNPGGEARVLAYNKAGTNEWAFGYENTPYSVASSPSGGTRDYNEIFMLVESITPVPEPGTLALVGAAGLAFALLRRRRSKSN